MRVVQNSQIRLGELSIAEIRIDARSRDDIPAVLRGLQEIYTHDEKREQLFALLEESLTSKTRHTTGRPGMQLWRIFVLATLKQGLNCDFDRLQQYANHHDTVRQMLGHGDWDDDTKYPMQTLVDNISLLSAEKLAEISQLVVEHGHEWVKKSPGDALRGRCDSFVVETDVHYPTDFNLLWDAMRVLVRVMVRACKEYGLPGWRQQALHLREVRRLFHRVRGRRRQDREERCRAYLDKALSIINKAEQCYEEIGRFGACTSIEQALADARRQAAQIERRVLLGETIPHHEKVFSLFERHTRWNVKGKAGVSVELGVPVCVLEDQYQFVLHHRVLWRESDVEVAQPMVGEAQERFPDLRLCSFDRNFHSPANRETLDEMLQHNVLPKKGRCSEADRERETQPTFVDARRQHPAVESCINNLEHRGLDRVRTYGAAGFERTVALSVVAYNLHRLGLLLQRQERERLARKARRGRRRRLVAA